MNEKEIFLILGIEPTREEEKIKAAYRNQLVKVNPEENAEGFKEVRRAYEEALCYAKEPVKGEKLPETPIELWIEQVKGVYESLSKRLDIANWEKLMKEDLCIDLDTSIEARDALLSYLKDNFRLKNGVWKLIDKTFLLREEEEELCEKFPKEFIQFIFQNCEKNSDFSYELFEGADDADYDESIYQYIKLTRSNEEKNWEESLRIIGVLEQIKVYHPFYEIEKAKYQMGIGRIQEAVSMINSLLERYQRNDFYNFDLFSSCAEVLWDADQIEEAVEYFEQLIEKEPQYYMGNKNLAHYYYTKGLYDKAKECCKNALETGYSDDSLQEDLKKINDKLIEKYETNQDEVEFKKHLEIGWCYLQNQYAKRGIKIFQDKVPPKENRAEYNSLMSRFYMVAQKWDKMIEYGELWLKAIREEEEDPEIEVDLEQIPYRLAGAYEIIARGYIGKAKDGNKECYEKALEKLDTAIKYDPNMIDFYYRKADIYENQEEYEKVIEVCDKMKEIDKDYFWTYTFYQKAFYELRIARGVIENFYRAQEIFPYYPTMYELVAQVYYDFDEYETVQDIIKQAKEYEVNSEHLEVLDLESRFHMTEKKEEFEALYQEACKKKEEFRKKKVKKEDIAEVYYIMGCCLKEQEQYSEAISYFDKALKLHYDRAYIWVKGNTYLDLDKCDKALEVYMSCYEDWKDSESFLERIGYCYYRKGGFDERLENYKIAVDYYEKVLELNPENERAVNVLIEVCEWIYRHIYQKEWYEKGLKYVNIKWKKKKTCSIYNTRGNFYLEAKKWELALHDFNKATQLDEQYIYAYINRAYIYRNIKGCDAELEELKRAAQIIKKPTVKLYEDLASCYRRRGELEKAVECYLKNIEIFQKYENIVETEKEAIFNLYADFRQYEKAEEFLEEHYKKGSAEYYNEKGDVYLYTEQFEKAEHYYKKALTVDEKSSEAYNSLAEVYFYGKKEYEKAYQFYTKMLEIEEENEEDICGSYLCLMRVCYHKKDREKCLEYFELYRKKIEQQYGREEFYFTGSYVMRRLYLYGCIQIYIGQIEKAKEYLNRMRESMVCRGCMFSYCSEYWELSGLIEQVSGNYERAKEDYQKALNIDPNLMYARFCLEMVDQK